MLVRLVREGSLSRVSTCNKNRSILPRLVFTIPCLQPSEKVRMLRNFDVLWNLLLTLSLSRERNVDSCLPDNKSADCFVGAR